MSLVKWLVNMKMACKCEKDVSFDSETVFFFIYCVTTVTELQEIAQFEFS